MHYLRESDVKNMWDVVVGDNTIGCVAKFDLLGNWKYVGTLEGKPVDGGPFNSLEEAARAVEEAWRKT